MITINPSLSNNMYTVYQLFSDSFVSAGGVVEAGATGAFGTIGLRTLLVYCSAAASP
tara:strand:- start:217 stop:387 length:171 start_codon:yes stop_codon:yes gene_type:complete